MNMQEEDRSARNDAMGLDMDDELAQLLKEQDEFMKQSKRPAAKVMRMGRTPTSATPAAAAETTGSKQDEGEQADEPEGPQIVGNVMERDVIQLNIQNMNVMPRVQANGFPAVQRRGESLFGKRQRQPPSAAGGATATAKAKPSRFSSSIRASTAGASSVVERDVVTSTAPVDSEQAEIDRTNNARLQEMSLQEIREAQEELMRSLDPALLEKLMSKKKNRSKKPANDATVSGSRITAAATGATVSVGKSVVEEETPTPLPPPAPLDLAKIENEEQLHEQAKLLPADERAKHEWMQTVPDSSATPSSSASASKNDGKARKEKLEATTERFDFNGDRVAPSGDGAQHPVHSGLFHHGDEPDAAGYTMAELIHLARSTVASQRAMALTTITKILQKRARCQQQQDLSTVFPRVLPNDLPITLRIALDDQNYTALSAGISALHAFLVPHAAVQGDEEEEASGCFEGVHGVVVSPPRIHLHQNVKERGAATKELSLEIPQTEEVIYIDTSESPEDGSSISDEELTFLDPVQGLLNMDIGTRLRYIIESIQLPDQSAMGKLLDILIRIANHSPKAAKDIGTNSKLMKALQRKFIENEDVLTLQEENESASRLTVKALLLVRALCQGSRAVAAFLIGNGVIQSTKGFLAIRGNLTSVLHQRIQLESLRIWRVLLKYGLDYHCFAYLFPILCGFRGVDLVRPTGEQEKKESASDRPARVTAALFAALEAFCGLETVHEAQHYFSQLGFFMHQAKDEILTRMQSFDAAVAVKDDEFMVVVTAFRFLASTCSLVTKYHLESKVVLDVFEFIQGDAVAQQTLSSFVELPNGGEGIGAIANFHQQVILNGILGDDMDEDDAASQFFHCTKQHLQKSIANSLVHATSKRSSIHDVSLTCSLLALTGEMVVKTNDFYDDAFVATIYSHGLKLMETFVSGQEYWIHELLKKVLFHPVILQKVGFFPNESDARAMSHVLIPIYQALVNTSKEQEEHSTRNFALKCLSPTEKSSCQLRIPRYEDEYLGSNLPLPGFWMFCPFSRMEFTNSSASGSASDKKPSSMSGPTRAESEEMKLIVSATCRFLYQLETAHASAAAWKDVVVAYQSEMRDEDKLFHLMHVFFAGADVLFDEHVDTALSQFLKKFALPVLKSKSTDRLLYEGILRNLRRFQNLDPNTAGKNLEASSSKDAASISFSSDEQIVMTFIEKLVADFTSSSYGNVHFARCVTLLFAQDFPIAIRKWVWKELQDCRLLHALQPFDEADEHTTHATFARLAGGVKINDEQLLQLMSQAMCQKQLTPERGGLAYRVALHHLTVYLFGQGRNDQETAPTSTPMSFARQLLAQDLVRDASKQLWHHLLTYEPTAAGSTKPLVVNEERVDRIVTHAGLSLDQLTAFRATISEAQQ